MQGAVQFLADDGADHLEIVAAQHGVLRRGRRGRETLAGAFATALVECCPKAQCEMVEDDIYAAASWGGVSFDALGFGKKSATVTVTPIDGAFSKIRRICSWDRLLRAFRSEMVGWDTPAALANRVWLPKRPVR